MGAVPGGNWLVPSPSVNVSRTVTAKRLTIL